MKSLVTIDSTTPISNTLNKVTQKPSILPTREEGAKQEVTRPQIIMKCMGSQHKEPPSFPTLVALRASDSALRICEESTELPFQAES